MKSILKKNQIVLFTVALMLIVAGYMNYTVNTKTMLETAAIADSEEYAELGDAKLVSSENIIIEESETNEIIQENTVQETNVDVVNNEITEVRTNARVNEYFVQSRIDRDAMFSQMIESYQKILENEKLSIEQRNIAQNEITNINNRKQAIMICENLIKNKGFDDVIIFLNDKSVNVVLRTDELTKENVAQIQNIIQRELKADTEDIHISNK